MIRQEPYPITPAMMHIAANPAEPWLPDDLYHFKTDPITPEFIKKVIHVAPSASYDKFEDE
jgi:hypothetical protein